MKRKVVYNKCYGGFGLSPLAELKLYEKKNPGKTLWFYKEKYSLDGKKQVYTKIPKDKLEDCTEYTYSFTKDLGESFEMYGFDGDGTITREEFNDAYIWVENACIPNRHDPDLIEVIEELGSDKASGTHSELVIEDIGDSLYHIDEYDGYESISTSLPENYWN